MGYKQLGLWMKKKEDAMFSKKKRKKYDAWVFLCIHIWTSVPVMRDVSGWRFWEEMTPWFSSASYKRSRLGSHTDTKMSRWKNRGMNQGPALVPTGCLSGYTMKSKAGRWKEVTPSPHSDKLTSFSLSSQISTAGSVPNTTCAKCVCSVRWKNTPKIDWRGKSQKICVF